MAVTALASAACGTSSGAQPQAPATSLTAPSVGPTDADLVAVAKKVVTPTGTLCDTHRDNAPSDVNACPYTDRLKAQVNHHYQLAWSGQGNPNPILSYAPCGPPGSTVISYFPKSGVTGGIVSLVATCAGSAVDPSTSWQRLVIVSVSGSLAVDDVLLDRSHSGEFVSVYGT